MPSSRTEAHAQESIRSEDRTEWWIVSRASTFNLGRGRAYILSAKYTCAVGLHTPVEVVGGNESRRRILEALSYYMFLDRGSNRRDNWDVMGRGATLLQRFLKAQLGIYNFAYTHSERIQTRNDLLTG